MRAGTMAAFRARVLALFVTADVQLRPSEIIDRLFSDRHRVSHALRWLTHAGFLVRVGLRRTTIYHRGARLDAELVTCAEDEGSAPPPSPSAPAERPRPRPESTRPWRSEPDLRPPEQLVCVVYDRTRAVLGRFPTIVDAMRAARLSGGRATRIVREHDGVLLAQRKPSSSAALYTPRAA